jgi:hypothetical protein
MNTKLERIVHGVILAPVMPLAGLMGGWWSADILLPERWIPFAMLAGLLAGILVDVILLKRLVERRLSWLSWAAVYLFYSIGLFGFFMGVPVFNAALAIPAGFVVGSRLRAEQADPSQVRKAEIRAAGFTTGVLALTCAASACIALADPYTAGNLRGMLGLGFEVTRGMIVALILVGGASLLAVCWGLTMGMVMVTFKWLENR